MRVRRFDSELGCDVVRVVGYVATCPEGDYQTPVCRSIAAARLRVWRHEHDEHGR